MALHDARRLVVRMREDRSLRERVVQAPGEAALVELLRQEGMQFDLHELVAAMAECMARMEQEMGAGPMPR